MKYCGIFTGLRMLEMNQEKKFRFRSNGNVSDIGYSIAVKQIECEIPQNPGVESTEPSFYSANDTTTTATTMDMTTTTEMDQDAMMTTTTTDETPGETTTMTTTMETTTTTSEMEDETETTTTSMDSTRIADVTETTATTSRVEPIRCSQSFTASPPVRFKSPNFPKPYYDNLTCAYEVRFTRSDICYLQMTFHVFDVDGGDALCLSGDSLLINGEERVCGVRIGTYLYPIVRGSAGVFLKFSSDAKGRPAHGFDLELSQVQCDQTFVPISPTYHNPFLTSPRPSTTTSTKHPYSLPIYYYPANTPSNASNTRPPFVSTHSPPVNTQPTEPSKLPHYYKPKPTFKPYTQPTLPPYSRPTLPPYKPTTPKPTFKPIPQYTTTTHKPPSYSNSVHHHASQPYQSSSHQGQTSYHQSNSYQTPSYQAPSRPSYQPSKPSYHHHQPQQARRKPRFLQQFFRAKKNFVNRIVSLFKRPFQKGRGNSGSYGAPTQTYGAPKPSYGAPSQSYGAPKPSYGAPKPSYGAPSHGYGAPQQQSYHHSHRSTRSPVETYQNYDSYGSPLQKPISAQSPPRITYQELQPRQPAQRLPPPITPKLQRGFKPVSNEIANTNVVDKDDKKDEESPGLRKSEPVPILKCGFSTKLTRFNMASPHYPSHHGNNVDCLYLVESKADYCFLRLKLIDFILEESNDCADDHLTVDGIKVCGQQSGKTVTLLKPDDGFWTFDFHSDSRGTTRGFFIRAEQIPCRSNNDNNENIDENELIENFQQGIPVSSGFVSLVTAEPGPRCRYKDLVTFHGKIESGGGECGYKIAKHSPACKVNFVMRGLAFGSACDGAKILIDEIPFCYAEEVTSLRELYYTYYSGRRIINPWPTFGLIKGFLATSSGEISSTVAIFS